MSQIQKINFILVLAGIMIMMLIYALLQIQAMKEEKTS